MTRVLFLLLIIPIGVATAAAHGEEPDVPREIFSSTQRDEAVAILREALEREPQWVKVHAAEFLLRLSYPQQVSGEFETERALHEEEPRYRIGIWRVLARASGNPDERESWIERIRQVAKDLAAPDRVHAFESLSKLGDKLDDPALRAAAVDAAKPGLPTTGCARWLLAGAGGAAELSQFADLLESGDATERLVAAYGLQWINASDPTVIQRIQKAAEREPDDSLAHPYLLSAAWVLTRDADTGERFREKLISHAKAEGTAGKLVASSAFAERGVGTDVATLAEWLKSDDADVRAAAAAAILRIARRGSHRLARLDWAVVGVYLVSMLAIGWYYSFRTSTTDEYLLGGRKMSPLAVGISLFATLCSTISYLSTPGEMVQHGPMYFTSIGVLPLITATVGWWLIPHFMTLRMTSAYEILETRLGVGTRLLGAIFFLAMRLLWMAVILDVTVNVVLLPLLGLDRSWSPWLCALLGLTTVIYSSMGGFRAVVTTDVIQSFILLGGAIAALSLITWHLGGVGGWWPREWASNWDPISLGFDIHSRMPLSGVLISTYFWYVCTAGSDQMAIQRYLATRDVKSARRMFTISMVAGAAVTALLALLGLGLLAWFQNHPEMLGEGQSVAHNADQLFPRYIVAGLPAGVSGLVVAGLLSAAMSSLSSGLSSSCSVITVDLFDRFSGAKPDGRAEVRRARIVSWSVGLVVVVLSSIVGLVQGNLLEVAFKVVNLLVAPLFGLFFMALFVRWATSFGTIVGAVFGVATVVAISYWTELTGRQGISFVWAMPIGLFVQVGIGAIASLIPIGLPAGRIAEAQSSSAAG